MAYAFNPSAYYIALGLPLLGLGVVGALISRRWPRAAQPIVVGLIAVACVEFWTFVSPVHSGVEAWPFFRHASGALAGALGAAATLVLVAARRRVSRSARARPQ